MEKMNTYNIIAELKLDVGINIKAESLEKALEEANKMKETDFVTIKDDFNNGSIKIIGLFENN